VAIQNGDLSGREQPTILENDKRETYLTCTPERMNLHKESGWINEFAPNCYIDSTDDRFDESGIGESNLRAETHKSECGSGLLVARDDSPDTLETESQRKLIRFACLYEISRDMLTIRSIDDLCQKLIERMSLVWRPCDHVFPYLEIDGDCFAQDEAVYRLEYKLSAPVLLDGALVGQIGLFYKDANISRWPENEDHGLLQNIANDLALWLEQKRIRDFEASFLIEARMIEKAINEHSIIAITDQYGKIIYVNEKFCSVSKYSAEELIDQDHRVINSGYHSNEFFRNLWSTIKEGKVWRGEIRNRAKDGAYYWVDTTIVPLLDNTGTPYKYVAMRTEVTEHKKLKQKMEGQVAELARSNDELEQFAYVVTHDLQEPLRAINSFVQLLKKYCDNQLDERANDLIAHTVSGTNRMQMLINDLLTYAQVNASQVPVEIDCERLLDNVLIDLSIIIGECNAVVTYDKLPAVKGIPFQFIQLFTNLINNALKFQRAQPPRIHIGAEENQHEWVFSVTDNGIGIEEQYLERIFRVFQRLHSRREYAGTGIGLAICKKVVEHHGGRIWVKSEPNAGSSFYFTVPKTH
jgi:PAS domain S-box-containing protein